MLILKTLALEPMHGYGIGVRLEQISKGVFQVNAGSLFPALRRLERDGLIAGDWRVTENNRRAKYYVLTPQGRATAQARDARLGSADGRDCQNPQGVAGRVVMARLRRVIGGLTALFRSRRGRSRSSTRSCEPTSRRPSKQKMRAGMARDEADPRRARRVRQPRSGEGSHARRRLGDAASRTCGATCATRRERCARSPAFTAVAVADPGARHRRQHRDLQRGQRHHAAPAAGRAARRADFARRGLPERRRPHLFLRRLPRDRCRRRHTVVDATAASTVRRDAITIDGPPEPVDLQVGFRELLLHSGRCCGRSGERCWCPTIRCRPASRSPCSATRTGRVGSGATRRSSAAASA